MTIRHAQVPSGIKGILFAGPTASGTLRCSGPKPAGWRDYRYGKDVSEGSVLSGDNLKVIYSLCSTAYRGCS